jgi:hypothetical protein
LRLTYVVGHNDGDRDHAGRRHEHHSADDHHGMSTVIAITAIGPPWSTIIETQRPARPSVRLPLPGPTPQHDALDQLVLGHVVQQGLAGIGHIDLLLVAPSLGCRLRSHKLAAVVSGGYSTVYGTLITEPSSAR